MQKLQLKSKLKLCNDKIIVPLRQHMLQDKFEGKSTQAEIPGKTDKKAFAFRYSNEPTKNKPGTNN